MEPTEGSETSAELKRTPGIYPKEHIQYLKPDESLKSRIVLVSGILQIIENTSTGIAIYQLRGMLIG